MASAISAHRTLRPKTPRPSPPPPRMTRRRRKEILPRGGGKKRAASTHLEAEASKKGKVSLVDNSVWDIDSSLERRPRDKPLAES